MIKNNIAFALRCVGGVVVIGGVSWSLYALLGGGTWFQPFLFFVVKRGVGEHRLGDFGDYQPPRPAD